MHNILFSNIYTGIPLQIIKEECPPFFRLSFLKIATEDCLEKRIPDADYLIAGGRLRINKGVLEKANKLRMIQRSGVGLDSLDLDSIKEKGIPLYVNQGVNAESVAEHTLLLMLSCLRKLPSINLNTKNGVWKKQEQGVQTSELKGKTVGIIGMGNIAKTLVNLLKPFQVNILYYNIFQEDRTFEVSNNMKYVSLDELLMNSDIVSIHCALTDETNNLINVDTIKKMKDGSILINTARGGIVDPIAVADALNSGKLSYAALDVHVKEPIPDDYPLKSIDNVILTPHIGGVTVDSFRTMMHDAFRNISLYDQGRLDEIERYRYL